MKKITAALVLAIIVGCGGTDSTSTVPTPPPSGPTCSLGSLTGAWRAHYSETNGTCGAMPDETGTPGNLPGNGCTMGGRELSADRCTLAESFTCPTVDNLGTYSWTFSLHQVSELEVTGSGTVQVVHPTLGACRSTYDITATKL